MQVFRRAIYVPSLNFTIPFWANGVSKFIMCYFVLSWWPIAVNPTDHAIEVFKIQVRLGLSSFFSCNPSSLCLHFLTPLSCYHQIRVIMLLKKVLM